MTDREQIEAIRSQTLTQLLELRARPKPSYMIDGQMVSWAGYIESLERTVDWCDGKLAALEPFEIHSRGVT